VPNTCVACSSALQQCVTCTNYTFCDSCTNNSFVLVTINQDNQVCQACEYFMIGCDTCTSRIVCSTCINNNRYLYIAATSRCLPCIQFTPFCLTCVAPTSCLTCISDRYALSDSNICQSCLSYMASCYFCLSSTVCTLCIQGVLVPDQSGCSSTIGCISVLPSLSISLNCHTCDTSQFLPTPRNGRCICISGGLIGKFCSTVLGCTATTWNNATHSS
jgi:hypothetical protein